MNRGQKRSYKKLHSKDKSATYCETCKINTCNRYEQFYEKDIESFYTICELCGKRKAVIMNIEPKDFTTRTIYTDRTSYN